MNNIKGSKISSLIAILSVATIICVLAAELANARPSEAPPGGNPVLNVQGPQGAPGSPGATGPTGSTGPQGPAGFSSCSLKYSSCSAAAFNGCYTADNLFPDNGYIMTGGFCGGPHNLQVYTWNVTSNNIRCYCHDKLEATAGTCYAFMWQCKP